MHEYFDKRHQQLGPVFREKLGPIEPVFISDVALIEKVFRNEGKYPRHMVPEGWLIYNQKHNIQRGLFFM